MNWRGEKMSSVAFILCLGMILQTTAAALTGLLGNYVKDNGPAAMPRHKRSLPNYYTCPPRWNERDYFNYVPDCPPGTFRHAPIHGPFHGQSCPPWVDNEGLCVLGDQRFGGDRCRAFYGESTYREWQMNAKRTRPPGPQVTPGPCLPSSRT